MLRRPLLLTALLTVFLSLNPQSWAQEPGGGRRPAEARQSSPGSTAGKPTLPAEWVETIQWRSIGPATMGGRITSIAVCDSDPSIWYIASASGGLLKTVNNGQTFEHIFDDQATVSIGDVQVSKSNPDIVWVGTGEANPRNSVSWGDGVYKSTDGGKTWQNMGLKESFQIGRIAIHPEDPDIVYAGALGRLWGPNEQRGLFKTTDGGKTWEKILFVNDQTGVIDVEMNPKDPNNLLVATYERQRDGFDGNDPEKRFGEGAGLYRTTDGGLTFEKITTGLPTGKMGRIGLDWYPKNPKFVYAVIESEKIGTVPENAGYAGLSGEDADVGARITDVVEGSPAARGGLQNGDIVLQVDGDIVYSYEEFLAAMRRHIAGDKVKLVLSRDRTEENITIELDKRPQRRGRDGQPRTSEFTGTLGGQAANLQGQQGGENEHEYGGVYMSSDAGVSWKRINTLNPRPMYYSQIRVDPSDRNNLYILGTSLYRSSDGGNKFTGDGGNDTHPDNHAMWIDPGDGRHMILGNDGGIYVTWDRMDTWEHYNKVAIGQFYHVGIDHNRDYKVYGGLQDNGSWGAPVRVGRSGPGNTDWFQVGGGDGFVTHVDPTDADQVYFESQNGAMGRINFRTGERGFVRPQPPRGTRYRFNWKTPFVLSSHNPEIHYSAGNHVFRSISKGDNVQAISPEISNSRKGAGSAISESPVKAGVLYVGTTDGAVWVTRDDGQNWEEIFVQKIETEAAEEEESESGSESESPEGEASSSEESAAEATVQADSGETSQETGERSSRRGNRAGRRSRVDRAESDQPPAGGEPSGESAESADSDRSKTAEPKQAGVLRLAGQWQGEMQVDQLPEDQRWIEMSITLADDGSLKGTFTTPRSVTQLSEFVFDEQSATCRFKGTNPDIEVKFECKFEGAAITGTIDMGSRKIPFSAKPVDKQDGVDDGVSAHGRNGIAASLVGSSRIVQTDDTISGTWKAQMLSDEIPEGQNEFELQLKLDAEGVLSGMVSSMMGEMEVFDGTFDAESGKFTFKVSSEEASIDADITGTVQASTMNGMIKGAGGQFQMEFTAERLAEETTPVTETSAGEATPQQQEKPASETSVTAAEGDSITGTWEGKFISDFMQGDGAKFQMGLKKSDDGSVTGWYQTGQGSGEIIEGKFDSDNNTITFVGQSDRSDLDFSATVTENKMTGDVEIVGRSFSFEFESERNSTTYSPTGESKPAVDTASGSRLADLVPGPRWVSSLDASRHNAGRVYITLDGHRSNDDEPYVFASENYGKTWTSIRGNLPATAGCTRVIREDIENENLLFLGCEFSAWVSIDRGKSWTRFSGGLPTVAVHDFAIHPTSGEIVAATHGRSLWIADISPLRQLDAEKLKLPVVLLKPNSIVRWSSITTNGEDGNKSFRGQAPDQNAEIYYFLGDRTQNASITIRDSLGNTIRSFEGETTPGLHRVEWDLRRESAEAGGGRRGPGGGGGGGGGRFGRGGVPNGIYLVTLSTGDREFKELLTIEADPTAPQAATTREQVEFEEAWLGTGDDQQNNQIDQGVRGRR